MSHVLFELDVRLRDVIPPIWRTIEIAGDSTLADLHHALQVAMGWTNSHLHQFTIDGTDYGRPDYDDAPPDLEDERQTRLGDVVASGDTFVYEYDFGDGWEHEITVKRSVEAAKPPVPRCTAGARACPPEDCGGAGGYAQLVKVLADPSHEEHGSMREWAGDFAPERFAVPKKGRDLRDAMAELEELADGDDDAEGPLDEAMISLPKQLIETVLELDPMQRASLAALIAGSLATEVLEAHDAALAVLQGAVKPKSGRGKRS